MQSILFILFESMWYEIVALEGATIKADQVANLPLSLSTHWTLMQTFTFTFLMQRNAQYVENKIDTQ